MARPITRTELVYHWQNAKRQLDAAKAAEMRWRMLIALREFPNVKLGVNWSDDRLIKLTAKETITLSKDKNAVAGLMSAVAAAFPQANLNPVVSWEYKLSDTEFRNLPQDVQNALAPILTIKPATPVLELGKTKE